jgi:hypothetical protein|tara:strand:- start:96 stop:239 length:144 start_codon:yes stop_codon:yes gene_type:complete
MSNKKDKPEFEIEVVNDTPTTSDGDSLASKCTCTEEGRDFACICHGG